MTHTPSGQQAVKKRMLEIMPYGHMGAMAADWERFYARIKDLEAENEALRAAVTAAPTAPSTDALRYAESIAIHLHANHYADVPHWEPLTGDLIGLLTQIDNMTVSLVRSTAPSTAAGEREEWLRDRTCVYRLVEGSTKKGQPVMVNEFTVQVQRGWGTTDADAEVVAERIRSALATPPAQVGVQENLDHAKQFLEAQGFQVFSTGPLPLPAISPAQVGEDRRLIANLMEAVGKVLFSCGEDWRCGPGAELLDVYEAAADVNINLFCSATPPPPSVPWEEQAARWHDWQASECQRIADAQRDTGSLEGFMAAKREQEWHRRIARDIRALLSKPAKGNGK